MVEKVGASCLVCHGPLEPGVMGRPPQYCSVACRRTAEHEIRRINRDLEALDWQRINLRMQLAEFAVNAPQGSRVAASTQARLEAVELLIAEGTERMRLLLAGGAEA